MHVLRWIALALACVAASACYPVRDTSKPPAVRRLDAERAPSRAVLVLPGIGDDLDSLQAGGIGDAIRKAWPDADVVLVEMTIGYYKDGRAMPDLHALVAREHERGIGEVWLVGASLGGMGAMLYDAAYPCDVDGVVLLAPYLGEDDILGQVRHAGGIVRWEAPPAATPDAGNWQAQMWRRAKVWSREGGDPRVWLAWGADDKFAPNMPLLLPAVPESHVVTGAGVHAWRSWTPLAARVFAAASDTPRARPAACPTH